jgi:hypothetical protein
MSNMKPFNLEEAKAGKPVVTGDKSKARIVCWDFKSTEDRYPLVVLVEDGRGYEDMLLYSKDGNFEFDEKNPQYDLFMAPAKKTGWINIYPARITSNLSDREARAIFNSKEEADRLAGDYRISTIQIEWEE